VIARCEDSCHRGASSAREHCALGSRTTDRAAGSALSTIAAAARGRGVVTWAAQLQAPGADEPEWLTGWSESQPHIVQSECVPALIAALEKTPIGAPLGCIAPTSLRYVIECEDEVLLYRAVPQELWRQIWSNNP